MLDGQPTTFVSIHREDDDDRTFAGIAVRRPLFEAISDTGGTLLGSGFLSPDAGMLIGTEVAAMESAAQVIAEAQALATTGLIVAAADAATDDAIAKVRAAAISVSEAQVLRYLPQPLPFSVIATKLGILRSAAKERAQRLYKKLGVHDRADAVIRARELRLIPA